MRCPGPWLWKEGNAVQMPTVNRAQCRQRIVLLVVIIRRVKNGGAAAGGRRDARPMPGAATPVKKDNWGPV